MKDFACFRHLSFKRFAGQEFHPVQLQQQQ
jgi:hypothetical protein